MAKLHRRRPDGRVPRKLQRSYSPTAGSTRRRRPRWSMPSVTLPAVPWARLVPGPAGWLNLAVVLCAVWCLYAGTQLVRDILARPPAPEREESVAVQELPDFEPVPEGTRIRVEILNGCGVAGIAGDLTDRLRAQNFDVVYEGNYKSNNRITFKIRETLVIDRIGIPDYARRVAAYLGTTNVIQQARSDSLLDVTVILGRDYQNLDAFR